jgi:hypothetical protein
MFSRGWEAALKASRTVRRRGGCGQWARGPFLPGACVACAAGQLRSPPLLLAVTALASAPGPGWRRRVLAPAGRTERPTYRERDSDWRSPGRPAGGTTQLTASDAFAGGAGIPTRLAVKHRPADVVPQPLVV